MIGWMDSARIGALIHEVADEAEGTSVEEVTAKSVGDRREEDEHPAVVHLVRKCWARIEMGAQKCIGGITGGIEDLVSDIVAAIQNDCGKEFRRVEEELVSKIRDAQGRLFQELLGSAVPKYIVVGGEAFRISEVSTTVTVGLSAGLDIALTSLLKVVSEGRYELQVKYAVGETGDRTGRR